MRYTFGAYTLDTHSYELCQAGMPLQLQPKVFDLLPHPGLSLGGAGCNTPLSPAS